MSARTPIRYPIKRWLGAASVALISIVGARTAHADDPARILKAMADYMVGQKSISATFESDIEIITPDLQKIQFASSGQLKLNRPDKLRVKRTGGYADVELVYDGKTVSLYGNNAKAYVQVEVPGTVDAMIDAIHARSGMGLPGSDLFTTRVYDELMASAVEGKHIGAGVVDGVECEHLAFRGPETDWQIWIETGSRPVPHKYVITSKTLAGAPQYTLRIRDWKTDAFADAETFVFKPPSGATKVDLESAAMAEFDELPPGTPAGVKQ